jgi:hypothetical protein
MSGCNPPEVPILITVRGLNFLSLPGAKIDFVKCGYFVENNFQRGRADTGGYH